MRAARIGPPAALLLLMLGLAIAAMMAAVNNSPTASLIFDVLVVSVGVVGSLIGQVSQSAAVVTPVVLRRPHR